MTTLTESDVEQAALAWLEGLSWNVAHGPDLAPDTLGAERADYGQESNYTTWRIAKDAGLAIGEFLVAKQCSPSDASRMALQRHRLTRKTDNNGQEKPQRT